MSEDRFSQHIDLVAGASPRTSLTADELLTATSDFILRFVVLSRAQADSCALWVAHTHAVDAADYTPYLHIHSPVLRSGKTRLLEVLRLLVRNQWFTCRVTASALVRKVDAEHPTLLLDESDAALTMRSEYSEILRGILNSGFEREGVYSMSVASGNDWKQRDFSTFSPKAIAGIGRLPGTVEDRAIPIQLKRAHRSEERERFHKRKIKPAADQLRDSVAEWSRLNLEILRGTEPQLPGELNDRQQDVCQPLLAIADIAGGEWPTRARQALIELCSRQSAPDDSIGTKLLGDIRNCFAERGGDRIETAKLVQHLNRLEESSWAVHWRGQALTANALATLLRPFEIRPRDIRFQNGVSKGYLRADFGDAWERYVTPFPAAVPLEGQQGQQAAVHAAPSGFDEGQQSVRVAADKSEDEAGNMRVVAAVALQQANPGESHTNGSPRCGIHPLNTNNWWMRGDDPVCGRCHPDPNLG